MTPTATGQIMGSAEGRLAEAPCDVREMARQTALEKVIDIRTARFKNPSSSKRRHRDVLTHQQRPPDNQCHHNEHSDHHNDHRVTTVSPQCHHSATTSSITRVTTTVPTVSPQ